MTWVDSDRVVAARSKHGAIDVVVGTVHGFQRHQTARNGAVLTYFGFLSVFPLFMVATSVLGFILQGNSELRDEIVDTAIAQIPVIGSQIESETGELEGSVLAVVIGLLIALWAATRAFAGLQNAFDDVWEIAVTERENLAVRRLRSVVAIVVIGGSLVLTTGLSSVVSMGLVPVVGGIALWVGIAAINAAVLAFMYRFMTAADVTWRVAWPGAILGGVGFALLQYFGSLLVQRFLASASDTAGTFAIVFALMAWLNLHAMVSLAGAELNAALRRRRGRLDDLAMWLQADPDHPPVDQSG
ncbi:MAG: YihY/virulence factor BrkB family protein [Ilumatobacteraceae bacterium]